MDPQGTCDHEDAEDGSVNGWVDVDSLPSSCVSHMTGEAPPTGTSHAHDALLFMGSLLPMRPIVPDAGRNREYGNKNRNKNNKKKENKKKAKSVTFTTDTAPPCERCADEFELGLRQMGDMSCPRSLHDTVRCLLDEHHWPAASAAADLDAVTHEAEYAPSARTFTEASASSYVLVNHPGDESSGDVAGAGLWADQEMRRSQVLDI